MNLFEVTNNIEEILEQLDEAQTEEEEKLYLDTLESLEYDFEEQCENIAKSIRNNEADAEGYQKQADFFLEKATKAKRKAQRRKDLIKAMMERRNLPKLKTDLFDFRVQKNGGKQGIEYKVAPEFLPRGFRNESVVVKPNEEEIRKALDEGKVDYSDFFTYKEKGTHLRIS